MLLTRVAKWSTLKAGAPLAKRSGLRKAKVPSRESLPASCTGCGSTDRFNWSSKEVAAQRAEPLHRVPANAAGEESCRDGGGGEMAPCFAMLENPA